MKVRGAPTVVLFFLDATPGDVMDALDEVAEHFQISNADPVEWFFPDNEHWRTVAQFDEKIFDSYTGDEKKLIEAEIGTAPSASIRVTLNGRVIADACDAAKTLALHLLGMFDGIAYDRFAADPFWKFRQIRGGKGKIGFLDCYRPKE
ncbi:MAG TPA: hypothetical protein VD837_08325 [Terriglobales bacterium]|nr:hypothetical protein [Terriglobales bacterium]